MKFNKLPAIIKFGTVFVFFIVLTPSLIFAQVDIWTFIGDGTNIAPTDSIYSIAVDPLAPDTIFAGGTNSRVFRTFNKGVSWSVSTLTLSQSLTIVDIKFHAVNRNVVYAATDSGGVYISINNGADWSGSNAGMADTVLTQLIINVQNPDTVFVVSNSGVYRSLDRGSSWSFRNDGLAADSVNVTSIGISVIDPATMYVGTSNGKIYQSTNFGISWFPKGPTTGPPNITKLIVDNADPDLIYVGTANNGVWKSTNAGLTFTQVPVNLFPDNLQVLSMAIDSSSTKKIYVGTTGIVQGNGVFQLDVSDTTFNAINTGLTNGKITSLEVDPNSPYLVYAGTIGQGIFRYIGNRDPVLTVPVAPILQTSVGLTVSFTVTATDPDTGETGNLVYNASGLPSGSSYDSLATRVFTWTPTSANLGNNVITFTVSDLRGGTDSVVLTINVNRPPTLTIADTSIAGREDSLITFTVTGADPDSDPLLYSVTGLPSGAVFDTSGTKTFTWTPDFEQAGSYTVVFTVDDGRTGIANRDVQFTISNINRAPTFNPAIGNKEVSEGKTLAFVVRATDLDADPISFGITGSLPQGAGFDSVDTKRFSWIPTFDDSGSYTVVFNLSDGQGGSTSDSVSIRVINVNRAPVFDALADTMFVNEGDSLGFFVSAVDSDSDPVSYNVANLPSGATFDKVTGQFFWIPNFSQGGLYKIVFNAFDSWGEASFKNLTIIVNQPPVWSPVSGQFTTEGVQLLFKLFASDADGDSLTYTITDPPAGAVVSFPSDSVQFSWTPQANQEGMYAVTFVVNDDKGGTDKVIVPIQVSSSTGQLPPTIIPTVDRTITENENVIFQVVATDDGPQDSLSFGTVGGLPAGSAFDSTDNHIFQWTPSFSQSGIYTLVFSVTDKFANTTLDTVIITVNNVNRAPVTTLPTDTTFSEGNLITLPLNITDPDGDNVSITYFEIPFTAVIDSSGVHTLKWTPTYLQEGSYKLRFTGTDDFNGKLDHTLNITIVNSNRAPGSFSIVFPSNGEEVKPTGYLIWQQAPDPDIDDSISYSVDIDDDPAFGSINIHLDTVNSTKISQPSAVADLNEAMKNLLGKKATTGDAFILLVSDIPGISSLADDGLYYWRIRAFDNRGGQSGFTGSNSFHLNLANDPPNAPATGFSPGFKESTTIPQPVFRWDAAQDPDYSDDASTLSYAFELSDNDFATGYKFRIVTTAGVDSVVSPVAFGDNETWYYRLKTFDDDGDSSAYSQTNLFFSNTINEPPVEFDLTSPSDNFGYVSRPDSILFDWEDSSDPDPGNKFTYRLEISIHADFADENLILYVDNISNSTSFTTISTNVLEKDTYYWRVLAIDEDNLITPSKTIRLFGLITSVEDDQENKTAPSEFSVRQNYPNPFNNQTIVKYSIPYVSNVNITIYSITGQIVYSQFYPTVIPGNYLFRWNGNTLSGQSASTGTYFLVIFTDRDIKSQKILLIK